MYFHLSSILASLCLFFHVSFTFVYTPCISPIQELQIRNRLALFAQVTDIDDYPLYNEVFAQNATATFYTTGPVYVGLDAIVNSILPLTNISTQIDIDTIVVNCTDQRAPTSVSYFIATNFLSPTQLSFAYGRYYDSWVEDPMGTWKIIQRRTRTQVSSPLDLTSHT